MSIIKKLLTLAAIAAGVNGFGEANKYIASGVESATTQDTTVDQFSFESPIVKTGEGDLIVGGVRSFTAGGGYLNSERINITINDGALKVKSPIEPVGGTVADDALANAYIHLDASAQDTIETTNDIITVWHDVRYPNGGHDATMQRGDPQILEADLNGLDAVDFRSYGLDEYGNVVGSDNTHFAWAKFDRVAIKTGFLIMRDIYTWNPSFVIGDTDNYQFHRNGLAMIAYFDGNTQAAGEGEWRIDGMRVNGGTYQLDGQYHLVSFRLDTAAYTSTLCYDRGIRIGGAYVGEVAYFEDKLSDDQMRAIEEKLLAKWFNKTHPATQASSLDIATVTYGENADSVFVSDGDVAIRNLAGAESFCKGGAGEMTINDFGDVNAIDVAAGKLTLSGDLDRLFQRAFIHVDPSATESITFNDNDEIVRMESINGNGRYLVPVDFSWGAKPTIKENDGRPVIDCGCFGYGGAGTEGTTSALKFNEQCTSLREAFVVCYRPIGSSSFLLGCLNFYNFHADGGYILCTYARDGAQGLAVSQADWKINNVTIDPFSVNFTNELAVYSVNNIGYDYYGTDYGGVVDRLGSDRDYCSMGGIQYGEVIVFDEYLTDDERDMIRNYLLKKWHRDDVSTSYSTLNSVSVGASAEFNFKGNLVLGGNAPQLGFTVPISENGAMTIDGDFTFANSGTFTLDYAEGAELGKFALLKADSFVNSEALANWTLAGRGFNRFNAKLSFENDTLYVTLRQGGLSIFIR